MELCPEGSTGGSSSRRNRGPKRHCRLLFEAPPALRQRLAASGSLHPGPRAPTPAPLTAAPASGPWRTLSSTLSLTPPPPSSARRPARRTRGARGFAGKWSPRSRPSPGARAASRPRRLRAALRFRPSKVVPSGKCSPSAEARGGKRGFWEMESGGSESLDGWWWRERAESGWRGSYVLKAVWGPKECMSRGPNRLHVGSRPFAQFGAFPSVGSIRGPARPMGMRFRGLLPVPMAASLEPWSRGAPRARRPFPPGGHAQLWLLSLSRLDGEALRGRRARVLPSGPLSPAVPPTGSSLPLRPRPARGPRAAAPGA